MNRRKFLLCGGALCLTMIPGCDVVAPDELITVHHSPKVFTRRSGDLSANVCGVLSPQAKHLEFRVNSGPWQDVSLESIRFTSHSFTVEVLANHLAKGENKLEIKASGGANNTKTVLINFTYDPSEIVLPLTTNWQTSSLDVQDGSWETFQSEGEWRVRPKPGHEGYDRLLLVTGAVKGGRRVMTDLIFRHSVEGNKPYGFGVMPIWGGHAENENVLPRRGWIYGLGWYYSLYQGVGTEFGYKRGKPKPQWVITYRNFDLVPGKKYKVVMECWPEVDQHGQHVRYVQRLKWQAAEEDTMAEWIQITDVEGHALPETEYAVALLAHRCQVEFGNVEVQPLPGKTITQA